MCRFNIILMSRKLRQAVCQSTDHEGEGGILTGDLYTKNGQQLADVFWGKHRDIRVPLWKTPHVQPLGSTRRCQKQFPFTSQSTISCWLHPNSQAPQRGWELRQLILEIGSLDLDVRQRSLESLPPICIFRWLTPLPPGRLTVI